MTVEFRVLGEVEAVIDDRPVDLGHAKQRRVLAVLLLEVNRVVPADQLLDRVWGDRLPQRARQALSSYVSRLRRLLTTPEVELKCRSGGYVLSADPMTVDLHRFRMLVAQARTADSGTALALLDGALQLWPGDALTAVDTDWLGVVRDTLNAERHAAELDRNDLALAGGRHVPLLGSLSERAKEYPLDERLAGQLILALSRSGRQADALRHYQQLRVRLADELGVDPSPPLQLLHKQILAMPGTTTPQQLPLPLRTFAGRDRELAQLHRIADASAGANAPGVVIAVSGMAGSGKTTLAVHWAHLVAGRFHDGQLFVNLRGFDPGGQEMTAAEALRVLLDALDAPPHRIPSDLDAQVALYRSLLADRRMLIVLDNARDLGQVRPLLPGSSGCLVVVTSRHQLTGLVAQEGAHAVVLDQFDAADARALLARHLGHDRIGAEPQAVSEIISRCAQLPLALSIVATRAATHPGFPLSALARELREAHDTLDAFADTDPRVDIRAVFSWSYQALSPEAARLFRRLGQHPGPDITAAAAASLAALPPGRARRLLAELNSANLVTEDQPGRYAMHDLARVYATERAAADDTEPVRHQAIHRMLDHYLHTALAADRLICPEREQLTLPAVHAGTAPEELAAAGQAMAWLAAEHAVLLAVIRRARRTGFDRHCWQIPWTLATYLDRKGFWDDLAAIHRIALEAARRLQDRSAQAWTHRSLATASARLQRYDDAEAHSMRAIELFTELGDRFGEAKAHNALSSLLGQRERHHDALVHGGRALELYRAIGDRHGQSTALANLGWTRALLGDYVPALAACQEALAMQEESGHLVGRAMTLHSLGYIHHHLGRDRHALGHYEKALELLRRLGSRQVEAVTLVDLGDAHHALGETRLAHQAWKDALSIFEDLGHPDAEKLRARISPQIYAARDR